MKVSVELANHEIRKIDDTVLVHNLDNDSVIQLNGTGGIMFLLLAQMLKGNALDLKAMVAEITSRYPEMAERQAEVELDISEFLNGLGHVGLLKNIRDCSKE